MVAADEMYTLGVSQLQTNKQGDGLDAEETAVYIISCSQCQLLLLPVLYCAFLTEEKVIGVWTEAPDFEYLYHVKELTMYISDHSYGRSDMYNVAFFHQQFFRFRTYCFDHGFCEELFLV